MDEATINNMKVNFLFVILNWIVFHFVIWCFQVAELKKELKARGFSVIGNKSDLVSRLLQAVRSANGKLNV